MFFPVEAMINLGNYSVKVLSDGWTAVTRDRSLSAQFEHTVGVTENGVEIFTCASSAGKETAPARESISVSSASSDKSSGVPSESRQISPKPNPPDPTI